MLYSIRALRIDILEGTPLMAFSEALKSRVKKKANFTCCWCQDIRNKVDIHHIIPQEDGGSDTDANAAPLCGSCHILLGANPELRKEMRARRDNWYKRCSNEHVLIAQEDLQEIKEAIRSIKLNRQETKDASNTHTDDASSSTIEGKWRRIYALKLPDEPTNTTGAQALNGWRFVSQAPDPSITVYSGGILGIGSDDNVVSARSPIAKIDNCLVECDIRILGEGADDSRWAGIRIRGFTDDFRVGYLVYLRSDGSIDFHRAEDILDTTDVDYDTKERWTTIRLEVIESTITLSVNNKRKMTFNDKWFGGLGVVYLHTSTTHAWFRNFHVFRLKST
jgi:hypothetical protein